MGDEKILRVVSVTNETTATQCFYEVSDEVLTVMERVSEEEMAGHMPRQSSCGGEPEAASYAAGFVSLAKGHGLSDDEIVVREAAVPSFFFDSGWVGAGGGRS